MSQSTSNVQEPCALIFPGQGSQQPGMRELVERYRPELVDLARTELGELPFSRAEDATDFAQPAIYCADLAAHEKWSLENPSVTPVALAGHSLGELAALVVAGSLRADDGLRLVALRARLMHECCLEQPGGMVAVLGRGAESAHALGREYGLTVANDNCPGQLVLSGPLHAASALLEREADARDVRLKQLPVAGAFHSSIMRSAVAPFRRALEQVDVRPPRVPVISGLTAQPFVDVRRELAEAVVAPVRWREVILELHRRGARRFTELGPGRVLTGLAKRTLRTRPKASQAALIG